jgi:hypothetical protein
MALPDNNELERLERALNTVDISRREALRKMVTTTAFVAPLVVSFAVDGLTVSPALAQANSTSS